VSSFGWGLRFETEDSYTRRQRLRQLLTESKDEVMAVEKLSLLDVDVRHLQLHSSLYASPILPCNQAPVLPNLSSSCSDPSPSSYNSTRILPPDAQMSPVSMYKMSISTLTKLKNLICTGKYFWTLLCYAHW
jgi:hypothetical protein